MLRSPGHGLDSVGRDILVKILAFVVVEEVREEREKGPQQTLFRMGSAHTMGRVATLQKRAQNMMRLRTVCKAFWHAMEQEEFQRNILEQGTFRELGVERCPRRIFFGGSYLHVLKATLTQLRTRADLEKKMESAPPVPMMACGMRAPPQFAFPHPADCVDFTKFPSLTMEEEARILTRARLLMDFLRDFESFSSSTIDFQAALLRYRAFLKMQLDHPRKLFVPTVDILFVQLAHILRNEAYETDGAPLSVDPLNLFETEAEMLLYNETVTSTSRLWAELFNVPYMPSDFLSTHTFYSENLYPSFNSRDRGPTFHKPGPFVPCVGTSVPLDIISLPKVSLTIAQLEQDATWFQELQQQIYQLESQPPYDGKTFNRLAKSYRRFIFIWHQTGSRFIPPVSIDLFWHAHQLTPDLYRSEMQRILGWVPKHAPESSMKSADPELSCQWKTLFGCELGQDPTLGDDSLQQPPIY